MTPEEKRIVQALLGRDPTLAGSWTNKAKAKAGWGPVASQWDKHADAFRDAGSDRYGERVEGFFDDLGGRDRNQAYWQLNEGYSPDEVMENMEGGWTVQPPRPSAPQYPDAGYKAPAHTIRYPTRPVPYGVSPPILSPEGFQSFQEGRLGADRTFAPGSGVRVAQVETANDAAAGGDRLSPAEQRKGWDEQVADAFDKEGAKLAMEWLAEGKRADVAKSVDQLREARAMLESGADNLSGPFVGSWVGQAAAPVFNPESVATKEAIEEVVQRNLRLILGAQFTEREGQRLIDRAFNVKLQEPENAKRVGRLLRSIEDAAAARESAAQHFMQHGTMVGWQGQLPTKEGIEAAMDDDGGDWVTLPNGMRVREKR